jgi:hypothetical protein
MKFAMMCATGLTVWFLVLPWIINGLSAYFSFVSAFFK